MYMDMTGVMAKFPYVAGPEMSILDAKIYMQECSIRHLPIVKENAIVGVLSQRDILRLSNVKNQNEFIVADVMTKKPFIVNQNESLYYTVGLMAEKKYGSVLITNDDDQLIGIFTTTDALKLLQNFLNNDPQGIYRSNSTIKLKEVAAWN